MENSYWEIKRYLSVIEKDLSAILRKLDDYCFKARSADVRIYLTKGRVKSLDSLYLKTKRKGVSHTEISDMGGFRVLCLFEKDIPDVHAFLLRLFKNKNYFLKECLVYNWDTESEFYGLLEKKLNEIDGIIQLRPKKKKSGYKSIHYAVEKQYNKNLFKIEVQLRTIVQDAWGELEHEISYKKSSVRPYVRQSVKILSKDLQNIDDLFSHLRNLCDKETGGEIYSNYGVGPNNIFTYEPELIDLVFNDFELKSLSEDYWRLMEKYNRNSVAAEWILQVRDLLNIIYGKIKNRMTEKWVAYWYNMEFAFLLFCEGKYVEAKKEYMSLINNGYNDRYCVFFRIGEIYSLESDMVMALAYFDEVEHLIDIYKKSDYLNQFRIRMRLAFVYWALGDEFIDCAIEKIEKARECYDKNKKNGGFTNTDYNKLINNGCWYYLDKYLIAVRSADGGDGDINRLFADANQKYKVLSRVLQGENISRNMLDTAAWFLYNKFLVKKDIRYLKEAEKMCLKMREYENMTVFNIKSVNTQKDHVQEIMYEAQKIKKPMKYIDVDQKVNCMFRSHP